jgi:hypothetical protein
VVAVTVAVADTALAVTVADDPAGTFDRIASAVPAVPVCAGEVMNPAVVEKFTVIPLTNRPLESRTVATIDATGAEPLPTAVTSVTVAGTPVVDAVVVGTVSDASLVQPTLKTAMSRNIQRMKPI